MTTVSARGLAEAITQSGIPLVEVARHSGTDYRELSDNAVFARLPLPVLIRIAQLVDFPVAKLFSAARDTDTPTASDDASTLGACLGDNPQGLSRDNLARALHWDLDGSKWPCATSTPA